MTSKSSSKTVSPAARIGTSSRGAPVSSFAAGGKRLLPFYEVNAEIAARTTPTALDLATAGFCAGAGVYAAMRPASDVATTGAGASIGISLVPPLCVSGDGGGTLGANVGAPECEDRKYSPDAGNGDHHNPLCVHAASVRHLFPPCCDHADLSSCW